MSADLTVAELEDQIRVLAPDILSGKEQPFYMSITGYDNDPRGLWDIPEAREFCQRVIDSGFVGLLVVETDLEEQLGALGCFMLARGLMVSANARLGVGMMTDELVDELKDCVVAAREKVTRMVGGEVN